MTATVARLNHAFEGRYRLEGLIGEGPVASVYLAEDVVRSETVALRVFRPEVAALVVTSRFLADIGTTKQLGHPNIPRLIDCGEVDDFLFYAVPHLDGETLRNRLHRVTRFPVSEAVSIASKVGEALSHAHGLGLLHGDLKPANILFDEGEPMLSSFGVLLALGRAGARLSETDLRLGTPYYMSPERAVGAAEAGPSSDIYALGCLLYEMLIGAPPFVGPTAQIVLGEVVLSRPTAPIGRRGEVPPNVDAAVRRALEKRPDDRFASATDFVEALADPRFRHDDVATTVVQVKTAAHRVGGSDAFGGDVPWGEAKAMNREAPAAPANGSTRYAERLLVKEEENIRFIDVDDIRFVESHRNHVRIHTDTCEYMVRRRIGVLESQLDPNRFKRIHRSTIVNLDSVDRLVPWFSGGYLVHLHSGEELKLSRGYAHKLFDQVGKTL
ncbi:MAG: LytTR family transcriptional regulator DNA-binding domain-containing protein [Gemmatimonadetes bacterium]|nr:LytTR family transcriptional regulator DNA-binding domain-containing protein [Gemmatimonadota bacterium]